MKALRTAPYTATSTNFRVVLPLVNSYKFTMLVMLLSIVGLLIAR